MCSMKMMPTTEGLAIKFTILYDEPPHVEEAIL